MLNTKRASHHCVGADLCPPRFSERFSQPKRLLHLKWCLPQALYHPDVLPIKKANEATSWGVKTYTLKAGMVAPTLPVHMGLRKVVEHLSKLRMRQVSFEYEISIHRLSRQTEELHIYPRERCIQISHLIIPALPFIARSGGPCPPVLRRHFAGDGAGAVRSCGELRQGRPLASGRFFAINCN